MHLRSLVTTSSKPPSSYLRKRSSSIHEYASCSNHARFPYFPLFSDTSKQRQAAVKHCVWTTPALQILPYYLQHTPIFQPLSRVCRHTRVLTRSTRQSGNVQRNRCTAAERYAVLAVMARGLGPIHAITHRQR